MGRVLEDGGSCRVDFAIVDPLQRGQWTPNDLYSNLHSTGVSAVHSIGNAVLQQIHALAGTLLSKL